MQVSEPGTVESIKHLTAELQFRDFSRLEILVDSKVKLVHIVISRISPSGRLAPDDRREVIVGSVPQIVVDVGLSGLVARTGVVLYSGPGRPGRDVVGLARVPHEVRGIE